MGIEKVSLGIAAGAGGSAVGDGGEPPRSGRSISPSERSL
jgi:hypothetical protein